MKFSEFKFERPDPNEYERSIMRLIDDLKIATAVKEQIKIIKEINQIRSKNYTMDSLAYIRSILDKTNKEFEKDIDYVDSICSIFEVMDGEYFKALGSLDNREELEKKFGKQIFTIAEMKTKSVSKDVQQDIDEENLLVNEYEKLKASIKVNFKGNEMSIGGLMQYCCSPNRDIRKEANKKYFEPYEKKEDEYYRIIISLIRVRTRIAKKLGFKSFTELEYVRRARDFDNEMVCDFREGVKKYLVPIYVELKERQRKRLNLDKLCYSDQFVEFNSGNATPKGDSKWIVEQTKKMYEEFSPETNEYINFMIHNELMDLENRENKVSKGAGSACMFTYYKSPFIIGKFNGTENDVHTFIHESGHAFQMYLSRHIDIIEYSKAESDICEIHSKAMEVLTLPWMNNFFEDDTEKYKYRILSRGLNCILSYCMQDEFEDYLYNNPEASKLEREVMWKEIEMQYYPTISYDDNEYLKNKGCWYHRMLIFVAPYYGMGYALTEMCGIQFLVKAQENQEETIQNYIKLCKAGGSKSFLELIDFVGLKLPFSEDTIKECSKILKDIFDNIDDSIF